MKTTRTQLKKIILEMLSEENSSEDINITMDVPKRPGFTFSVKAKGNVIDAFFEDEAGNSRKISDNPEDKELLLGILTSVLDTSKGDKKQLVVKLISRLTGESEKEEDSQKILSKIKLDRKLKSYVQHVMDSNTRLV